MLLADETIENNFDPMSEGAVENVSFKLIILSLC
jgi:hypothetical protein